MIFMKPIPCGERGGSGHVLRHSVFASSGSSGPLCEIALHRMMMSGFLLPEPGFYDGPPYFSPVTDHENGFPKVSG